MTENRDQLLKLMRDNNLNCHDVSKIVGRSWQTVRCWSSSASSKQITDENLVALRNSLTKSGQSRG